MRATLNSVLDMGVNDKQKIQLDKPITRVCGKNGLTNYGKHKEFIKTYTDKHPQSILKIKNPSKSKHPTQKPVDLCEWLIKSYSNPDDTVLDFTMGSGSTGVACKNIDRKFIGIELNTDYYNVACDRIK